MIRTQIQLPTELYHDLKRVAKAKEWSLAETLRRGAELLLRTYPDPVESQDPWSPPKPRKLGWRGLSHAEIRAAALDDMESLPPTHRAR